MDSELPPPAKKLRAASSKNVQLTECIREFTLPRQYPSIVPKLINETTIDKNSKQTFTAGNGHMPNATIGTKKVNVKETPITNKVRTMKLKSKDGRDLGEINITELPRSIQGKTITIAKKGIKRPPEVIPVTDETKGITIGILTPVNILEANEVVGYKSDDDISPVVCIGSQKDRVIDISNGDNSAKNVARTKEPKRIPKILARKNSQKRPQVVLFQTGKNWRMVKVPNSSSKDACEGSSNIKNVTSNNLPVGIPCAKMNMGGIRLLKEQQKQKASLMETNQNGNETICLSNNKTASGIKPTRMVVRRSSQPQVTESSMQLRKSKSPINTDYGESVRPKIEISRVVVPSNKSRSSLSKRLTTEISKSNIESNVISEKRTTYNKEIVVSPLVKETLDNTTNHVTSLDSQTELTVNSELWTKTSLPIVSEALASQVTSSNNSSGWRRKLSAQKYIEPFRNSPTKDPTGAWRVDKNFVGNGEIKNEMTNNLSIVEKALSTVEDEVLRAKALKALADCGIGTERLVPIRPPSEQRPVKDSNTQTSVFGLWEPKGSFIYVPKESPTIQRIPMMERAPAQNSCHIITNPHSQEAYLHYQDVSNWLTPSTCTELTNMVEGYVSGNADAAQVASLFAKPSPVRLEVIEQLEKDFNAYKKYDENGLLGIHKAVMGNEIKTVRRLLFVLQACNESADLPTQNGQTSLELAIRYDASPKLVQLLLDAGAQPTSTDTAHDSALILASKHSLPILIDLISYVNTPISLNNYDSTGFAALHYCAQNNDQEGVNSLIRATADVNLRDQRSGRTPLFHAVENEHNDLAQILLQNGAEPGIPNYGGQTIFNVIDESKHYNLLEVLKSKETK